MLTTTTTAGGRANEQGGVGMRLTASVRQQLLDQNDGFKTTTKYSGKNHTEYTEYTISDGKLHIRKSGKSSWADSRYSDSYVADNDQTHRFLYEYQGMLNTDGIK
ncbi:hypothetical protein ACFTWH_16820 [Streptomyces sp. NPDC057011]|uniref:hypothetical protein n=1 Tax=unclassified Streptomyces TaxID=2593676 RepID=UPI003645108A